MITVSHLHKRFRGHGRTPVIALDDVSLTVGRGDAVGLVGESGSGKSTLLRCLMRLERPDEGSIEYAGQDVARLHGRGLVAYRRGVQMVFQDPMGSLNPMMSVGSIVAEGLRIHNRRRGSRARTARVGELLELVGLNPDHADRHPAAFSGGQRQRIAIARALAVEPDVLVCDEPVSALDVSVQAQILNLLQDMRSTLGLSLLFIAHDLAVVRYLCEDIYVLKQGRVVEHASREDLFRAPAHEYTRQLLAALPSHAGLRPVNQYALPPQQKLES